MINKVVLSELMDNRRNNLDLIRFLAATLVIFSHSYPLVYTNNELEPLYFISNQKTFGELAVAVFFIISGFLITQSFERSSSSSRYFLSRFLRIFPGLIGCLLFTVFIIGPLLTSLSLREYLTDPLTYNYFTGITLLPNLSPSLPGVFESNPFGNFVNGSLWTLKFEFLFYIAVAVAGSLKLLNKKIAGLLFIICLTLTFLDFSSNIHNLFMLGSYFIGGMLVYLFRDSLVINVNNAILSLVILISTTLLGYLEAGVAVAGTYLIIFIGYQQKIVFPNFSKYGDISYGLYIYAFPIQQAVIAIFGYSMTPINNFLISLPFVGLMSFLSWHLIEKKALKLKKKKITAIPKSQIITNTKSSGI
ncbi:acyltransferase family protein [Paenibacillus agaridevorans]|uniref:acyltransferase family protein n=1 Tax=Paenibacillus agaridevorans TaxID=171404 RepID=UPI000D5A0122|nr:acyltransferase [Paenibacillus agaridevorans]